MVSFKPMADSRQSVPFGDHANRVRDSSELQLDAPSLSTVVSQDSGLSLDNVNTIQKLKDSFDPPTSCS